MLVPSTGVDAQPNGALAFTFSQLRPGKSFAPWKSVPIAIGKRLTHYDLVDDHGTVVLHAVADNAASALGHTTDLDVRATPFVEWRWKIAGLIRDADPHIGSREDAPARVVFEFDGDKHKLSLLERGLYKVAERVAGRELPYATLMYIWANDVQVGTVVPNPHTRRVQMVVAASGAAGVGQWQMLTRNVVADFRRAFGEEPGRLKLVAVLTDTDNTDGHAEAWYGDLRFQAAR